MKNILSAVRGWVVVGVVLASGGAWGQGSSKVEAPNGCSFILNILPIKATIFKTEGKCINGYASGDWFFGITLTRPDGTTLNQSVFARTFAEGNDIGISMNLNRTGGLIVVRDSSLNGTQYDESFAVKGGDLLPLIEINRKIDRAAQIARDLKLPVPNIAKYKNLVMNWHKDSNAFVDQ